MSFFAMMSESMVCYKKMSDMPGTTQERWKEKLQLLLDFEKFMQQSYMDISDSARPLERLAKFGAMEITVSMHLLLRRPPHKQQREAVPPWDDFDVLEVATAVLERHLQLKSEAEFARWAWKSWVQWHALAVVLAELCSRPPGPNTDRPYSIATESFARYANLIADSDSGMLWKPIAKLMRRVQQIRQKTPSTPDLALPFMPPPSSTNPSTALDFAGYSSDTSSFDFQGPIPTMNALPVNLDWYSSNNDVDMFMNGGDRTMNIYNDPDQNWALFLDDVNVDYNEDLSNTIY
jgi:hypothetical protein